MLRILIADDHEVVRRGIKEILNEGFPLLTLGEARDTVTLVDLALNESWDIIISDLSMPGGGGIEALARIREQKPEQKMLIMSIYAEDQYAIRVLNAGASGFLNKDIAPDELIRAVQTILDGKSYVEPTREGRITEVLLKPARKSPHETLSDRELDVMRKIAVGLSVTETATMLSLTPNTVSTYRSRILNKLGVYNNAGIIKYALDHKLI